MRSIWSGSLTFGLVNIPVQLYSAATGGINLDMFHRKDRSPIRFARICKKEEKEIPYQEIVRGYKLSDDRYVTLEDDELKMAAGARSEAIEIVDFCSADEVSPMFYQKPYYLEPDKGAGKSYELLLEALRESKKIGIARFALRTREHLFSLFVEDKILVLNQLRYAEEIASTEDLKVPAAKEIGKRELDMALKLIDQLSAKFNPASYQDHYIKTLTDVIEEKSEGKIKKTKAMPHKPTKITDLMAALQSSLNKKKVVSFDHYKERKLRKAG